MNDNSNESLNDFVTRRNEEKILFTPGPSSLLVENLSELRSCFGRGDSDYSSLEDQVLELLTRMSGHRSIARMQGSASLALEVLALNFLYGDVLIIDTGYYSERLKWLAYSSMRREGRIRSVTAIHWESMDEAKGRYDWVWACPTETSAGIKIGIKSLSSIALRLNSRLALDATASIGLEAGHDLADVIAYSSCKGLFGLTGASFVAFNEKPRCSVDSFYLDLKAHLEKRMTGPYHAIASLAAVLPRHREFRESVVTNKLKFNAQMAEYLTVSKEHQPLLCTHVNCTIGSSDPRVLMYSPRSDIGGSVICHLGEVHLGAQAQGDVLDLLEVVE